MFTRAGFAGKPSDQRRITGGARAPRAYGLRRPTVPLSTTQDRRSVQQRPLRSPDCLYGLCVSTGQPERPDPPRTGSSVAGPPGPWPYVPRGQSAAANSPSRGRRPTAKPVTESHALFARAKSRLIACTAWVPPELWLASVRIILDGEPYALAAAELCAAVGLARQQHGREQRHVSITKVLPASGAVRLARCCCWSGQDG